MKCDIYRPRSRKDVYLFVQSGIPPQSLTQNLSSEYAELEFVKSREIISGQNLVGATADEIIKNISFTGIHIQNVKITTQVSEGGATIGGGLLGASLGGPIGALIGAAIGFSLAEHAKKVPDDL